MTKDNKYTVPEQLDALIKKCIEWDRSAQNTLYKLFASTMYAVCCRYSKSREEAEDILQEGFMKVFENIGSFRKDGSLEGWIRRIMVNTAIQKFRKKKIPEKMMVDIDDSTVNLNGYNSNDIISQIGVKELMQLIQKLSPAYQMVFNLYVFEGLKHKEIAEQLGISEGTSKSNLSDARAILQKQVAKSLKIHTEPITEHGRK